MPPRAPQPWVDDYAESIFSEDDRTLPGGDNFYNDDDDDVSVSSFSSHGSYEAMPPQRPYRVPKEHGITKPVYEAWIVYRYSDRTEKLSGKRILGVNVSTGLQYYQGDVNTSSVTLPQDELASMHLAALDAYHGPQKSCMPFARSKTYEQSLDERIQKTHVDIQRGFHYLLEDRNTATSSPWRTRKWSVVMVREQLHRKIAHAEPVPVERHRFRRWKDNARGQPTEFFCIIRGVQTEESEEDMGFSNFMRPTNPWKHPDAEEHSQRFRAWQAKTQSAAKARLDGLQRPPPGMPPRRVFIVPPAPTPPENLPTTRYRESPPPPPPGPSFNPAGPPRPPVLPVVDLPCMASPPPPPAQANLAAPAFRPIVPNYVNIRAPTVQYQDPPSFRPRCAAPYPLSPHGIPGPQLPLGYGSPYPPPQAHNPFASLLPYTHTALSAAPGQGAIPPPSMPLPLPRSLSAHPLPAGLSEAANPLPTPPPSALVSELSSVADNVREDDDDEEIAD